MNEETNQAKFSDLPFRFAEIAKVLLDVYVSRLMMATPTLMTTSSAADDLQHPDKLRSLLKDLREARQAKSRDGLRELDHNALSVRC